MNDEYSWLEDLDSSRSKSFYELYNLQTDEYFADSKIDNFASQLTKISEVDVRGLPRQYGQYTFWVERKKKWQKPKLLCSKLGDKPVVVLDFETSMLSLDFWYPSPDGSLVLYGTSEHGNEQTTIRIVDIISGSALPDLIPFAGFTDQGDICWLNNNTFIYPRMNGFEKKGPKDKWLLGTKLYRHILGEDPSKDQLVFGKDTPDTVMMIPSLSSNKKSMYVTLCDDELTHSLYSVNLSTLKAREFNMSQKSACYIKSGHGKVYLLTNYDASRYRLLMAEEKNVPLSLDDWDEVLPESVDILQDFWIHSSGSIVAKYSHNVSSKIMIFDDYGNQFSSISIPHHSVVSDAVCNIDSEEIFLSVLGFTLPTTHYKLTSIKATPEIVWKRDFINGDDEIVVEQQWVTQSDGCEVPYFLIKHRDTADNAPCIIYGYGGFNIALEPSYLTSARPWVMAGGVYVVANLRGGSEFGEDWHNSGSMEYKQNTFSDCISIAEDLISKNVTSKSKLGVMGGSNGGLLVAAVTLQRPDLFRAGVSLVPLTDMLEFYKHQVAEFWVHEYGDPRIPKQREWILKWSPYHYPIDKTLDYPAMYYETALHDARVHPFHAFKMVARLEAKVSKWKGPLLLRSAVDTGHQSSNKSKIELARQTAGHYAFFARELGL